MLVALLFTVEVVVVVVVVGPSIGWLKCAINQIGGGVSGGKLVSGWCESECECQCESCESQCGFGARQRPGGLLSIEARRQRGAD